MLLGLCVLIAAAAASAAPSFTIANNEFVRDGTPTTLRAGCIHYSRVPVEYWDDRIARLRAMGLNAIQTYVPWNWHVAKRGQPDFSGDRNLTAFLQIVQKHGMLVALRAGPYMCGEWEFGGLPAWIFENGSVPIRTDAEPYITHATEYWRDQLLPEVKPMLYSNGGPVVMVQVENEYGSYGDVSTNPSDKSYMEKLVATARGVLGDDVILFTTDGGSVGYMTRGTLKGSAVYSVGDGCGNPQTCIDAQRQFNAPGMSPFMCSECYTGWLTHWGEGGANTSSSAPHVDTILGLNGSVSLYMGHGGTNWGFWSGANGGGGSSFQPHETSYDYDSPVSEGGEHGYHAGGDKFAAMQAVLTKHGGPAPPEPPLPARNAFGNVSFTERVPVLSALSALAPAAPITGLATPPATESVGCHYGFALYTAAAPAAAASTPLAFSDLKDRVQVFVDGLLVGTSYRVGGSPPVTLTARQGSTIHLLLENMGRINYGHGMDHETKGVGNVTLGGAPLTGWTFQCLPFEPAQVAAAPFKASSGPAVGPALFRGTFNVDSPADTFLLMDGWSKGVAWVNGFALGRYWQTQGPQRTLYVPGPKLVAGANTLVVLELENGTADATTQLVGQPQLQAPPKPPPSQCDAGAPAKEGAAVRMVVENPKFAHQQQWTFKATGDQQDGPAGQFALQSDPTLCVALEPGCPHASSGCVVLAKCDATSKAQMWALVPAKEHPGSSHLITSTNGQCMDIWSHDSFDGAPLGVWSCAPPYDQANEEWTWDVSMGHLASVQAGDRPGPYLVTVCQ